MPVIDNTAPVAASSDAAELDAAEFLASDLALALRLADDADVITRARFQALDLDVVDKPDMTPVSDADLATETLIRSVLARERSADSVLGEEFGGDTVLAGRQWVIDPIDGTKNFVRGVPVWATLISLLVDGVPQVGVVSAPALNRRWWASTGRGAWMSYDGTEPRKLAVSAVDTLGAASLSFASLSGWHERGLRQQFLDLTDDVWRVRGYGDFYSYCLVAEGAIDIATEPEVSLWDLAAVDILVREAGGQFTSIDGEAGPHGGSATATNGLLQSIVLERLGRTA